MLLIRFVLTAQRGPVLHLFEDRRGAHCVSHSVGIHVAYAIGERSAIKWGRSILIPLLVGPKGLHWAFIF